MTLASQPRQAVTDSLDHLFAPVPGFEPDRRRRRTVFIGGGCLFWLVLWWVYLFMFVVLGMYVGAVFAVRLIIILGALSWWGIDSLGGVIRRRKSPDLMP